MRALLIILNMTGVPRLVVRLMLDRRVPMQLKMILPVALVYLISPLDLIRDMVPVLGRIDDVLVIAVAVVLFLGMAPKHLVSEHTGGRQGDGGPGPQAGGKVIAGTYRFIHDPDA